MERTCYVITPDGLCPRVENARGLCSAHLWRQNHKGDVLAAIPIGAMPYRAPRTNPSVLFWSQVNITDHHWRWAGALNKGGYGTLGKHTYGQRLAHRFAWTELVGPIPTGMVLDHQCRDRACVRPLDGHLRLVTPDMNASENSLAVDLCRNGLHPWVPSNIHIDSSGARHCQVCLKAMKLRSYHKNHP